MLLVSCYYFDATRLRLSLVLGMVFDALLLVSVILCLRCLVGGTSVILLF